MKSFKRTVLFTVIVLAFAGVYGALRNLPVVSGCAFYGECPKAAPDVAHTDASEPAAAQTLSASAELTAP